MVGAASSHVLGSLNLPDHGDIYTTKSQYKANVCACAHKKEKKLLYERTIRPTSPYSPRFLLAMLFLDFTLYFIQSKLRIVFFLTPCKRHNDYKNNKN